MTLHSAVEQEIRTLIRQYGRITFAQFMQAALYSRRGGFYASDARIDAHFGTSAMTHPAFGALIARQLSEMWHLLGAPRAFDVIEVGSGDGSLARSIVDACRRTAPDFAQALCYVAADFEPRGPRSHPDIRRVKAEGLAAFRNVVGCILTNELIDNFPVHRFSVRDGRIEEIFVTVENGELAEVLGEPSSPRIEERIASLGLDLPEGFRGEVNLRLEDWTRELARALDRGFVLTIDYGGTASELYCGGDTLVCYHRHAVRQDPYRDIGRQDITCHVDFTSLMRLGERHGLTTVGYTTQRQFLTNLGFPSLLAALETQDVSAARGALSRLAMNALVDPQDYGDLEVLAQAKGLARDVRLAGFARPAP